MPTSRAAPAPAGHDHTHPVPELAVDGRLAGRPARFTLRPAILDDDEGHPAPGVSVRAALHFRIPLAFEAVVRRHTPGQWATEWVRCQQESHLASVRAVEPLVAPAVVSVVEEHAAQLLPLLDFAREREAGHALARVQKCRQEVADASRRLRKAEADFARHGVPARRALEVLEALTRKRDTLWGRPRY
ncbi:hypothetical protein ACIPJN_29915 [Streptomyces sp. NPDC086796]|uniref:hypothetical protein n=1 Tax=Streptomyces sp. NPDC086796 TaxID=3365760 RepID=UPI00382208C2